MATFSVELSLRRSQGVSTSLALYKYPPQYKSAMLATGCSRSALFTPPFVLDAAAPTKHHLCCVAPAAVAVAYWTAHKRSLNQVDVDSSMAQGEPRRMLTFFFAFAAVDFLT